MFLDRDRKGLSGVCFHHTQYRGKAFAVFWGHDGQHDLPKAFQARGVCFGKSLPQQSTLGIDEFIKQCLTFTGQAQQALPPVRGADLLVCECGGSDEDPLPGHLHPAAIASLAREAQPKQIWLTHFYPAVDAAHAVTTVAATGVATRRAADGDTWVP